VKAQTPSPNRTRIISVGGGKGGVGKSLLACNLAVAMAQLGRRVVLADLDLGAANQHLLLGVDRPKPGIEALLSRDVTDPRAALNATPIANLSLLAGSGAKLGAANITHAEKLRIIRKLRALEADVVIVDVGAGVGYNALDFFELGAQRLVVTTPQVTAIHDAYSFLKSAVLRTLQHSTVKPQEAADLAPATSSGEGEKVVDMLARLRDTNPSLAQRVFEVLQHFGATLIGNQVTDPAQTGIFTAVSKMMHDYLGVTVPILGYVKASASVAESVNRRSPVLVAAGNGEHARTLRAMAETLLVEETVPEEELLIEVDDEGMQPAAEAEMSPEALAERTRADAERAARAPANDQAGGAKAPYAALPVRIYQPPPRKRPPDRPKRRVSASAAAASDDESETRRRRRPSLPGLTPLPATRRSTSTTTPRR
jgi:flagellar biosynthesis protein FlhG